MTPALAPLSPGALWGGCEIRAGRPRIHVLEDVFVLPYSEGEPWGVFDASGDLAPAAADLRFPEGQLMGQALKASVAISDIAEAAPDAELIYAGRLHSHYGHFVIESLARLWPYAGRRPPARLLVHALEDKEYLFSCSYVAAGLAALGVAKEDVLLADRPLRIRRLVVPEASFQQQAFAYPAFADLCRTIGERVRTGRDPARGLAALKQTATRKLFDDRLDAPLYLSKRWLTSGVRRIANEAEVEEVLHAAGVNILYPELVPFGEQLRLLAERKVILGTAGSALHTTVFGRSVERMLVVSPEPVVNSNFPIFDRLTGIRSAYFHAESRALPTDGRTFAQAFAFERPREVAEALLGLL